VTGDGFFAPRLVVDFLRGAAFFGALLAPAFRRAALVPFDLLFAALFAADLVLLVPREAARFDAVDDLRRAFPPDDFGAVAMIISSRKVQAAGAQDSRAHVAEPRSLSRRITGSLRIAIAMVSSISRRSDQRCRLNDQ